MARPAVFKPATVWFIGDLPSPHSSYISFLWCLPKLRLSKAQSLQRPTKGVITSGYFNRKGGDLEIEVNCRMVIKTSQSVFPGCICLNGVGSS
jgi:hypothetical protein